MRYLGFVFRDIGSNHLLEPVLALIVVFLLLMLAEYWWRAKGISSERTRKLVHIAVGSFVAFWPLFISWRDIEVIGLAFIAVVIISQQIGIFNAIHSVNRTTWGELLFGVTITMLALFVHTNWIFVVAMLHLSIADGVAAVIGTRFGKSTEFKVFGHTKSIAGSVSFLLSSLLILITIAIPWGHLSIPLVLWLAVTATVTEMVAVEGTDNLFVPLLIAVMLHWT